MKVDGTIKAIFETVQVSEKFSKREFVVTTKTEFPQDILIQVTNDKCGVLQSYKIGDEVSVSINIRGREWTSQKGEVKYFNTIEGWKIEKTDGSITVAEKVQQNEGKGAKNESEDLPF